MSTVLQRANANSEEAEDEDYASFLDLFSGMFFMMLLLVLMLFLLMGDSKSESTKQQAQELSKALADIEGLQDKTTSLEQERRDHMVLFGKWETAQETWFSERKEKEQTIGTLQARLGIAETNVLKLGPQEKALADAQTVIAAVKGELASLNGAREKDKETFGQWKEAQDRWFAEREALEDKVGELGEKLKTADENARKVGPLEASLAESKKGGDALQVDLTRHKEEQAEHMKLFAQWKEAQERWFTDRKNLDQTIGSLQEQLKVANGQLSDLGMLKMALTKAKKESETLQTELVQVKGERTKHMDLFGQWDKAQSGWFDEKKKKDEEISSLKSAIAMMTLGVALTRDFGQRIELDASGFRSGSIDIPFNLEREIEERVPGMEVAAKDRYNTIEIIGHTDGDPVTARATTADDNELASAIVRQDDSLIGDLRFKSNMELGMARALAVYRVIAGLRGQLPSIKFIRVYSAGQYTRNNNIDLADYSGLTIDTPSRRKIEIRLTYSKG